MSNDNIITLVVVSDDHYVRLLAALVKSAEESLSAGARLNLWVIEDGITARHKKKLEASVQPSITTLHWQNINNIIPGGLSLPIDRSSYPLNIYARLFIPFFMPAAIKKVLYLDADMIVLADLCRLWQTNLAGHVLAAVTDPRIKTFDNHWGGVLNHKELGLAGSTPYFNTGLLLMDVQQWREKKITEQTLQIIEKNKKFANYPDQYGLNIALAHQWLVLDPLWNHFASIPGAQPYILHFVDRKPMYAAYKHSEQYRTLFYKYLQLTAWKNTKPISELRRYRKKLHNVLMKVRNMGLNMLMAMF